MEIEIPDDLVNKLKEKAQQSSKELTDQNIEDFANSIANNASSVQRSLENISNFTNPQRLGDAPYKYLSGPYKAKFNSQFIHNRPEKKVFIGKSISDKKARQNLKRCRIDKKVFRGLV